MAGAVAGALLRSSQEQLPLQQQASAVAASTSAASSSSSGAATAALRASAPAYEAAGRTLQPRPLQQAAAEVLASAAAAADKPAGSGADGRPTSGGGGKENGSGHSHGASHSSGHGSNASGSGPMSLRAHALDFAAEEWRPRQPAGSAPAALLTADTPYKRLSGPACGTVDAPGSGAHLGGTTPHA